MRWTTKALVQRVIAALPSRVGDPLYYRIQRRAGFFRHLDPFAYLEAARELAAAAGRAGLPVAGARILEVGTGRRLLLPIAFRLMGARAVTTVDLHRYLKTELVRRDLDLLLAEPARAAALLEPFVPAAELSDRLARMRSAAEGPVAGLLEEIGAEYRSPADAGRLADRDASFDLHVSRSVMEHVPPRTWNGSSRRRSESCGRTEPSST
jgi:hypothetical protein